MFRGFLFLVLLPVTPLASGQEPDECHPCEIAGYPFRSDVNGDWEVDLTDAVYLLQWLFTGGLPPDCPAADPSGEVDYYEFEDPGDCCVACGDANGDSRIDLGDPVKLLGWLYLGGGEPRCYTRKLPICVASALLVGGGWVEGHLDDEGVQIADVRSSGAFATSRIPGALRVDMNLLRATIDGIPGQVAPIDAAREAFRASGLRRDATIVVYGSNTGTTPARLVWTLHYYGHNDTLLLDGGWGAWTSEGRPLETTPPGASPSEYEIDGAAEDLRVTAGWIAERVDDPWVFLVDARSSGEYGRGHIPGALSVDWNRNVSGGAFRPRAEVADLYETIPPEATVVTYCQTGSRASVAYFALRWLGFPDVRLYDGSWAEWGSRDDLPRETQ